MDSSIKPKRAAKHNRTSVANSKKHVNIKKKMKKNSKKKTKKKMPIGLKIFFGILFVSLCVIGYFMYEELYPQYTNKVQNERIRAEYTDSIDGFENTLNDMSAMDDVDWNDPLYRNIDWNGLKSINPNIIGWIYVPGTQIDYAIVRNPSGDESYYLHRDIYGGYHYLGSIFTQSTTPELLDGVHTVIYGHNMSSGRMFGDLSNYASKAFRDTYPYVFLYTPERTDRWYIFSAFHTHTSDKLFNIAFEYEEQAYKEVIEHMLNSSAWDIGTTVTDKDKTLTLSTCADNGTYTTRFTVHCALDFTGATPITANDKGNPIGRVIDEIKKPAKKRNKGEQTN